MFNCSKCIGDASPDSEPCKGGGHPSNDRAKDASTWKKEIKWEKNLQRNCSSTQVKLHKTSETKPEAERYQWTVQYLANGANVHLCKQARGILAATNISILSGNLKITKPSCVFIAISSKNNTDGTKWNNPFNQQGGMRFACFSFSGLRIHAL